MAEETVRSIAHFQQIRNRQAELRRKNTLAIKAAARAKDKPLIRKLLKQRVDLNAADDRIFEAEVAFAVSGLPQSDAERVLIDKTRDANKLVKALDDIGEALDVVKKFTKILTDLIGLL